MTRAGTESADAKAGGQAELFLAAETAKRDWERLASIYGKSARTLKRYDQDGRKAGDLCPLEEPGKMAGWWQKHMKQQVPAWLSKAAAAAAVVESGAIAAEPVADVPPEDPEEAEDVEVLAEEMGLEKTLERLAKMEVRLSRQASKPGQNKAWLDTISRMGTVAEKLRVEGERLGKLWPRDKVEEAIHAFHGPIEREIRLLYRTMCTALGLPPTPENEAKWNEEVDTLFRHFGEEVFR
jgi:hypothetical protein